MATSRNLADIRQDVKRFHRNALHLHEAGPYAVVEVGYCGGCSYHVFIDGKYTRQKADTLDQALVLAMGIRARRASKGHVEFTSDNGLTVAVHAAEGAFSEPPFVEVKWTSDPDELARRLHNAAAFVEAHRHDRLVVEVD